MFDCGDELIRRREATGLSRDEAAERLEMAVSTLYRIEIGQARPQGRTLRDLLNLYGVTEDEQEALVTLSKEAGKRGWWQSYDELLPSEYSTYISLESEASSLRRFQPLSVPGVLQTEAYARALTRGGLPEADTEEIERQVEVRLTRQGHITKDNPQFWAVLDEAVLRRAVGGPEVMAAQLRRLAQAAFDHAVTVLNRGPVPRRPAFFPANSLAHLDACELLDAVALSVVPGIDAQDPGRDFADWGCRWESSTIEAGVHLIFNRDNDLTDNGQPTRLGGRRSYVAPAEEGDLTCVVHTGHRRYMDAAVSPPRAHHVEGVRAAAD